MFYIIGDIHGMLNNLSSLINRIRKHLTKDDVLVFLGDYIDRGSYSFEVIEYLLLLSQRYNTIFLNYISATAVKSKTNSAWQVAFGVITSIDGTDADIAFLDLGQIALLDTLNLSGERNVVLEDGINLTVSGGSLTQGTVGYTETTTDVNTGITLNDSTGSSVTPAVGDIICKVENIDNTSDLDIYYSVGYRVE